MKKFVIAGLLIVSSNTFAVTFFTIGTGGVTGSYFPMGTVICRWLNTQTHETNLHCNVQTGGSVTNINNLKTEKIAFGFAQSDVIYQAYHGTKRFEGQPYPNLRSIMAIYPEMMALVVDKRAGIKTLTDIKGKKINVGNLGSGHEVTTRDIFQEVGLLQADLKLASHFKDEACPSALNNQLIEGYFYMGGHPTANIRMAANLTKIDLIPISGNAIDNMIAKYPYYIKGVIPSQLYQGINEDIPSIGVKAVLVTSVNASNKEVRLILKTVLDNFAYLKHIHPLLRQRAVTKENLLEGLSVPLHPAAHKYYQEVGLLKE